MKNKLKKYCMTSEEVADNLELPSKEYLFVMLAENQLIFSNLDGMNYGYNEILKTEKILKFNKYGQWKWSLDAIDFLKNKLRIRTENDIVNNIITFL